MARMPRIVVPGYSNHLTQRRKRSDKRLTARAEIHLAATQVGEFDGGATEMAALAGSSVGVKPVLLSPDQTLLLQLPDQRRRVDDAACAIGAAGQANDLAREFE